MPDPLEIDETLAEEISQFYADPYGFVMFAYPWREPGTQLADFDGPDEWQKEELLQIGREVRKRQFNGVDPVKPIREAIASGHGIGKSALVAWLVDWIASTRPFSQGTVTANTGSQLETKTWAQITKWTKMCITAHWFVINTGRGSMKMYHKDHPESWFCTAQTCREENSEAFAGQHAINSTSYYINDEASAIPEAIWEVEEGGLTDGEPMMFAYGNPTKSNGKFHRIAFGKESKRWNVRSIDSRTCKFPNKAQIAEWEEDYGEDSDFFRVRVRGLPPSASDLQFIDSERVYAAQRRDPVAGLDDPLIVGVDIARGGADNNVIRFRRGLDAKSIKPIKIPGEESRDSMKIVMKIVCVINQSYLGRKPDAVFVDGTGIGGPICDRLRQLGYAVFEIQFGAGAPDRHYANMRAYMWQRAKDWLLYGAIDDNWELERDLTGPQATHNKRDQLLLESKEDMKKRQLPSQDDGDAFALTFAMDVAPVSIRGMAKDEAEVEHEYDPYG